MILDDDDEFENKVMEEEREETEEEREEPEDETEEVSFFNLMFICSYLFYFIFRWPTWREQPIVGPLVPIARGSAICSATAHCQRSLPTCRDCGVRATWRPGATDRLPPRRVRWTVSSGAAEAKN